MNVFKFLIACLVAWFAMEAAMVYGSIWDSRSNPTRNVEVTFSKDRRETGALSRNWDKSWQLVTDQGRVIQFKEFDMLSIEPNPKDVGPLSHWRALMPVTLVAMAIMFAIFVNLMPMSLSKRSLATT